MLSIPPTGSGIGCNAQRLAIVEYFAVAHTPVNR
jgi:hypothetical protein